MAASVVFSLTEDADDFDDTLMGSQGSASPTTVAGGGGGGGGGGLFAGQETRSNGGGMSRKSSTTSLSLSRRGSGAPGGTLGDKLRAIVSQRKERFKDDDYDLDFTYITKRIIAMGFPSSGAEAYYRNPIEQVEQLLEERHKGHYRVYNLCSERQYDSAQRFRASHVTFPFDDHHPPMPFSLAGAFVADALEFLSRDPQNVIAVHCKAGKGRTGTMIACLLLSMCPEQYRTADAALAEFASMRTRDSKGVTIPSQKRYVGYWAHLQRLPGKAVQRRSCRISSVAVVGLGSSYQPFFKVKLANVVGQGPRTVLDSRRYWKPKPCAAGNVSWDVKSVQGLAVHGDVLIDFKTPVAPLGVSDASIFRLCFNVDMEFVKYVDEYAIFDADASLRHVAEITLQKPEIDGASKDKHHKKFSQQLQVKITLDYDLSAAPPSTSPCVTPRGRGDSTPAAVKCASTHSDAFSDMGGGAVLSPLMSIVFTDSDGNFISIQRCGQEGAVLLCVNAMNKHTVSKAALTGPGATVLFFEEVGIQSKLMDCEPDGRERLELLRQLHTLFEAAGVSHDLSHAVALESPAAILQLSIFNGRCVKQVLGGLAQPTPLPFTFDARDRFFFIKQQQAAPQPSSHGTASPTGSIPWQGADAPQQQQLATHSAFDPSRRSPQRRALHSGSKQGDDAAATATPPTGRIVPPPLYAKEGAPRAGGLLSMGAIGGATATAAAATTAGGSAQSSPRAALPAADSLSPVEILQRPGQDLFTREWKVNSALTPPARVQVSLSRRGCNAIPPDASLRAIMLSESDTLDPSQACCQQAHQPHHPDPALLDTPALSYTTPPYVVPKSGNLTFAILGSGGAQLLPHAPRWVSAACGGLSYHAAGKRSPLAGFVSRLRDASASGEGRLEARGVDTEGRDVLLRAECGAEADAMDWLQSMQSHSGWEALTLPGGASSVNAWQALSSDATPRVVASVRGGSGDAQSLPLSCCGVCTLSVTPLAQPLCLSLLPVFGVKLSAFLIGGTQRLVDVIAGGFLPFFQQGGGGAAAGGDSEVGSAPASPASPPLSPRPLGADDIITIGADHTLDFFDSPSFPFSFLGSGREHVVVFAPDAVLTHCLAHKFREFAEAGLPVSILMGSRRPFVVPPRNTVVQRDIDTNVFNAFASHIMEWIAASSDQMNTSGEVTCAS